MVKKSQVIFMKGKEKALKALFSLDNPSFGYLAIGYVSQDDNGFEDPDSNDGASTSGFNELEETNNYHRVQLKLHSTSPVEKDPDTGKVLVKFEATLDENNIKEPQKINQFAIVDSANIEADYTIYSATTFPVFTKTVSSAITFVVGFRL